MRLEMRVCEDRLTKQKFRYYRNTLSEQIPPFEQELRIFQNRDKGSFIIGVLFSREDLAWSPDAPYHQSIVAEAGREKLAHFQIGTNLQDQIEAAVFGETPDGARHLERFLKRHHESLPEMRICTRTRRLVNGSQTWVILEQEDI